MALDLDNLYCAWATCRETVTHVCIQTDQSRMVFKSAAGLVCEKHAYEPSGVLSMPLSVYVTTMTEMQEAKANG